MGMTIECVSGLGFYVYVADEVLCDFIKAHSTTVEQLSYGKEILAYIDNGSHEDIKEKFYDYSCQSTGMCGLYGLIADVMTKETGVIFNYYVPNGDETDDAILYKPCYPWEMTEADKALTADKLRELMQKYIKELGGELIIEHIQIDYLC